MKYCKYIGWLYILVGFIIGLFLGERYAYYTTGLVAYTSSTSEYAAEDLKYYEYQPFGCKVGKGTFGAIRSTFLGNATIDTLTSIVKTFCSLATAETQMGEELFDGFAYAVASNLFLRIFDVDYIGQVAAVCDDYSYIRYEKQDYIDYMMKRQPKINRQYPRKKPAKIIKMLQISDAHVDRGYLEGTNPHCKSATCCRPQYGPAPENERPGYWGHVGKCDIPMRTAESAIKFTVEKQPDFIIWTGDNLDHYVWFQTYENQFFNQRHLKRYLLEDLNYTGPIYPVLGNHEGVPSDMFDYKINRWVFEVFADIWKDYLTPDAYRNMSAYGYYHMKHLDTNLRIIGTFSMAYDIQNWYLVPNHTDYLNHLRFLEETLEYCEHNKEVAYIIGHIPPGDVFTLGEWSTRFRALVNRFTNIIRGQFYGHTHYDEFKNVKSYRDDELSAGTVWAVGSMTSYPRKEPGIRTWEVDAETWHIWDFEQYRMYLDKANKAADNVRKSKNYTSQDLWNTGQWEVAYRFKEYYGLDSMNFEELAKLVERTKTDKKLSEKLIKMMHCEGPDSVKRIDEQKWTYCRFANSVFDDHWEGNGNTGNMLDYVFQGIQVAHGSSGDWWHKEPTEKYTRQ